MDLRNLYEEADRLINTKVSLQGWIKNHRKQKEFGFIDFTDGTYFKSIQIVYDNLLENFDEITKYHIGSAISIIGLLIESPGQGQNYEIKLESIVLEGSSPEDYPIQPKRHTREFLREQAYLRPRVNLFNAVFRIRSVASFAIHEYFQNRNYVYLHSPLITGNDGEGAGEMFKVTTLDLNSIPKNEDGTVNYKNDFFNKKVGLTVTGQLQGEAFALAYKKIYTFGPTFRAENSNTKTHAAEFWMIEPEMAFCDLNQNMSIMESMLKFIVSEVLRKCPLELEFLNQFVDTNLLDKLNKLIKSEFVRITHEEAITILKDADVEWQFKPEYGADIAREHEKYLTEVKFNAPVFVYNWPKEIKAFYMKINEDNKTVAAVDLEVPGAGELMGGSQREEDYDKLVKRMEELKVPTDDLWWYLNLRKYGGCVHSGFGMGFERLLIYLTGVDNIRDVIPFPRTSGNCEY